MDEIIKRIADCYAYVAGLPQGIYKVDCTKMYANVEHLQNEISKEMVACRRKQSPTIRFNELYEKLDEATNMLEKHILFAALKI